jgi:hypothetical protein
MGADVFDLGVKIADHMKWFPGLIVPLTFLALGLKGYTALKEPSDTWDEILKTGSIVLMAVSAIVILVLVIQLVS